MKTRATFGSILIAAVLASAAIVIPSKDKLLTAEPSSSTEIPTRRGVLRASFEKDGGSARFIRLVEWNPERAIREVMSLPISPQRDEVLLCVAAERIRTDSNQAFNLGASLPVSPERDDLLLRAIRELALSDPEAAIARAKSFVSGGSAFSERLIAAALVEWSEVDPHAAACMAALELREGKVQDDAVVSIAQRWHQKDAQAAEAWVDSFPPVELRSAAIAAFGSHSTRGTHMSLDTPSPTCVDHDRFQ